MPEPYRFVFEAFVWEEADGSVVPMSAFRGIELGPQIFSTEVAAAVTQLSPGERLVRVRVTVEEIPE